MAQTKTKRPLKFYQSLPKVDLHRHLEGSIRLNTLLDIGRTHNIDIRGAENLRPLVQVGEGEPYTFENFLSKFITLREFFRSPEAISRITYEAIEDAAADNVRYLELRFTPVALGKAEEFPLGDVMDWVVSAAKQAGEENDITTRLIASVNRHESVGLAEQVTQLAVDRKDAGIVGLDLAGAEANFSAAPFKGVFADAVRAGMQTTIHAGEWGDAANVREAIELFGTGRIGHGVRVMEEKSVVDIAREHGAFFEVCITSNYQSGVVPVLQEHPFAAMLSSGLHAGLNTDDPSICQVTLSYEYHLACEELGIPLSTLAGGILTSANAAFLTLDERQALVKSLEDDFKKLNLLG